MSRGKLRSAAEICADCGAPDPTWASINRGLLICEECCCVHRSLGRHISQVKSLKKGAWTPTQLSMVHSLCSSGSNSIWEYTLLDPTYVKSGRRKPSSRDPVYPAKADFIRAKHQNLAFVYRPSKEESPLLEDDLNKQLHSSVRTANLETSLRLLSLGADPNYIHPEKGNTPLHMAAKMGQSSQVELLVVYGADPAAVDKGIKSPADYAKEANHPDLADRLVECQYELTDRLAYYLCGRKPDHRTGQHFIIPEMADSLDLSELASAAKRKLQALPNNLFEELAMDVYDEVDRRETDAIWLSTQNQSALVTDRQTVPFLPVNPDFSSTRNQGRQKLARFNAREFATLIIDILSEVKRRQQGSMPTSSFAPRDKGLEQRLTKSGRNSEKQNSREKETLSDDEPLYDSVASDEECGNGQQITSGRDRRMATITEECRTLPPTAPSTSSFSATSTALPTQGKHAITGDSNVTPESPPSEGGGEKRSRNERPESVASSDQSDSPITLEEYLDVRKQLSTSEIRIHHLMQNNRDMKQEIAILQNMVQKLMQENSHLRTFAQCGTGEFYKPSHLPNGYEPSPGHSHPSSVLPSPIAESLVSRPRGSPRSSQRPQSMFEPRERQQVQTQQHYSHIWTAGFPMGQGCCHSYNNTLPRDDSGIGHTHSSHSSRNSGEYDNTSTNVSCNSSCQQSRSSSLSPSDTSVPGHSHCSLPPPLSPTGNGDKLPNQDEVIRKTEQITKKIQELLISAQEGKHDSFIPCSEKVYRAVLEMASIFPQSPREESVYIALKQLMGSAFRLQAECKSLLCEHHPIIDYRFVTQQMIQCAYDIAKAAKQLVTLFQ